MKRTLLALAFILTLSFSSRAQYVPIPDQFMGQWLGQRYSSCLMFSGGTYYLDTICSALVPDTSFVAGYGSFISDLTGIQYLTNLRQIIIANGTLRYIPALPPNVTFLNLTSNPYFSTLPALPPNLWYLGCSNDSLTSLPALPTGIVEMDCNGNHLTSLPALPDSLQSFSCSQNSISSLPALPPNLRYLGVSYNHITSLPALPSNLNNLSCEANNLTALPALPDSIQSLTCNDNSITALPSLPANLYYFNCNNNQIAVMPPLPSNLNSLDCYQNHLVTLPTLPDSLRYLSCGDAQFTSLPALNNGLQSLNCGNSSLTALPALPASLTGLSVYFGILSSLPSLPSGLTTLYLSYNHLTSLPALPSSLQSMNINGNQISSLPSLPASLRYLYVASNQYLGCLPNVPDSFLNFDYSHTQIACMPRRFYCGYGTPRDPNLLPLCTPSWGCPSQFNIAGSAHEDTAATCTIDSTANGGGLSGIKLMLSAGGHVLKQTYSNGHLAGAYSFQVDSPGLYTVSVDTAATPYAVICPTAQVRVNQINSLTDVAIDQDFGFRCPGPDNGVISTYGRFRQGRSSLLHIVAGDVTAGLALHCDNHSSGTVTIVISGPAHYLSATAGALTPTVSGNTLVYHIADYGALSATSFDMTVQTDPTALLGSYVCIAVSVVTDNGADTHPANDVLNQCFTVFTSYDPNEKTVSPAGPVGPGDWLTYTIDFQNKGNDTAYDIIVRDTLSPYLDASSFRILASSHSVSADANGNALAFYFRNIDLVDSMHNVPLSKGWVQYKVRTIATLGAGNQIRNNAAIYFDFNPAIVTNTTISSSSLCSVLYTNFSQRLCQGSSYVFDGQTLSRAGIFHDTLTAVSGCDSIVTLTLVIDPVYHDTISQSICNGSSFTFGGNTYNAAGYYSQTFSSVNGCDSFVTLHLSIKPVSFDTISQSICAGDSISFGGTYYNTSGTYAYGNGCDTFHTLHLSIRPLSIDTISQSICSGSSFTFGGNTYSAAGYYSQTLTGVNGCDSTSTLHLMVKPLSFDTISQSICAGGSFTFGGNTYRAAGYYSQTLTGVNGCDSTSTLLLTVKPLSFDTISQSICSGDSFTFGGNTYRAAGYYSQTLTGVNGCDSTITLQFSVNPILSDTFAQSICNGDSFAFAGNTYHSSGFYAQTLSGVNGCDSLHILHLTVRPTVLDTVAASICPGDSIIFGGIAYYAASYYLAILTDAHGCDSFSTLHLSVRTIARDTISQRICAGDSFTFSGTTYRTEGYYSQRLAGVNGCDSFATLHLSVKAIARDTISQSICPGDSITFGGNLYGGAGYYSQTLTGVNGCDSFSTLHLTLKTIAHDTTSVTICAGDSVRFGANIYRAAGYYSQRLTGRNGCDSFAVLHLSVNALPVVTLSWQALVQAGDFYIGNDTFYCPYWAPNTFAMLGGLPLGGTYSGTYISHDTFSFTQWVGHPYTDTIYYSYTDAHGCTATVSDTVPFKICEGINDMNAAQLIHLYPNPNNGSFTLETTRQVGEEYAVYDVLGQVIQEHTITADKQQIDLGHVAPAVYTLIVKGKTGSVRFTVIR